MKQLKMLFVLCLVVVGVALFAHSTIAAGQQNLYGQSATQAAVEPGLRLSILSQGRGEYWVYFRDKADLSAAYNITDWDARGRYVYDKLRGVAATSQASALGFLEAQKAAGDVDAYRAHFIVNAIWVKSGVATLDRLAGFPGVVEIRGAKVYAIPTPEFRPADNAPQTLEWGIDRINAELIWSNFGTRGEGMVVANVDTGVDYLHSALTLQYRGNLGGGTFDHNFNFYDPAGICPPGIPCDNNGHGSHTMGTMVGDDGGTNQIGMAPGARWIAAKGCESNFCSDTSLLSSAEWIAAPCPVGTPPGSPSCDPTKRPNVVNNSWGGGGGDPWYQASVDAWRAAGIFPAFSAGNSGPGAGTIGSPGDYCNVTASGATDISDVIASFSSRGPGNFPGCLDKPDVSAPGVNVRSSVPGNSYGLLSGTSMASPHTAGCVALLLSIDATISYDDIYSLLTNNAVDLGAPGFDYNYGYGRIDCYEAALNLQPDFRLIPDPTSQAACIPAGVSYAINVFQIAGFTDPVTLSASGVPAGYMASFDANPVIPPGVSNMAVDNTGAAAAGSYTIEVMGVAPTSTHTTTVSLNLYDAVPGTLTPLAPSDGATGVDLLPTLDWTAATQGDTYIVRIATDPGFANVVYSATVEGTTHTVTAPLDPLTTYYWGVRADNPCGQGPVSDTFSFTTRPIPPILLVDDDDNGPDVRAYYTDALDALAASYDIWDTNGTDNEPTLVDLSPYSTVIWFTGVSFGGTAGPGAAAETALGSWLESGNCMVISSQDYYYDRGLTPFMSNYLGVSSATSDVAQTQVTGQGTVFGGLGPYALSYPFTNYSDIINPDGLAELAFSGDVGNAAVDKDSGVYRTSFWGFPFEAVSDANGRFDLMGTILNWCGAGMPTGVLQGTVTAVDSGMGIDGATISADDGMGGIRTTTTDAMGDYSLSLVVGIYDVTASADNYVPVTVTDIDIMTDTTTLQDFVLEGSVLTYAPDAIEEFMEFGEIVTNTVTVTNTGPLPIDWSVRVRNYQGPNAAPVSIPAASDNYPRGIAAPSVLRAPANPHAGASASAGLPGTLGGSPAYGIDLLNSEVLMLMTNDPANTTVVGSASGAFYAGDFLNGDFATLYVVNDDVQTLYALDTATAALTPIGPSVPGGGLTWTGLAGDPTTGIMYGAASNCADNALYEVDVTSGALSLVGNPAGICLIDIAVNTAGEMYGVDIIADTLVQIDKTNGAVTTIGPLGFDANFAQGMDFDEGADVLYLAAYNNALGRGELRIADVTTGATTLVGAFGAGDTEVDAFGVATGGGGTGDWASASPESGTIPPNTTATIDVVFNSVGMTEQGDYTAELAFSGTYVNEVPPLPLTMHLSCPTCGQLEGAITDAWTADPVSADIHIVGPGGFDVTVTGDSYALTVQPGLYDFTVTADGYLQAVGQAEAMAAMTTVTDFALTPAVAILEYAPAMIEDSVGEGFSVVNTLRISNTGTVPFSFELADFEAGYAPAAIDYACPPDSFGYTCLDSNETNGPDFNWIDISATGTNLGLTDDSYYFPIDLPFAFNFYGSDYMQVAVGSNGVVYFEDAYLGLGNTTIPSSNSYGVNSYIAAYWDDLNPGAGGAVYAQVIGDAPTRKLVVQWQAVPHFGNPAPISVETILFEGSNNALVQYLDPSALAGSSATEGIQGSTTVGLLYAYNQAILTPELAICYVHPMSDDPNCAGAVDAPWAIETPMSGSVDPGDSMDIDIIFDSSVVTQTGTYTATLTFAGDFDNDVQNGTLVMHVLPPQPAIELAVTLSTDGSCGITDMLTVDPGTMVYYCYTVTNTGNLLLDNHSIDDTVFGHIDSFFYELWPGTSESVIYTQTIMADVTSTATWEASHSNTGLTASASDSAMVDVVYTPAIEVSKTVGTDPAMCAATDMITVWEGATVYYCYTVTNTGNITLPLHDLEDDMLGTIFTGLAYDLAPGASVDTVAAGLTISATAMADMTNTATWTAYDNAGMMATASDSATVMVTPIQAGIVLTKTVGTDPATCATTSSLQVNAGDVVYYCYTVMNTGNYTLPLHDLVDDQLGAIFTGFAYDLAPGASVDTVAAGLMVSATITADMTNVATWTAYDDTGTSVTATSTATVTLAPTDVSLSSFGGTAAGNWLPLTLAIAIVTGLGAFVIRRRQLNA